MTRQLTEQQQKFIEVLFDEAGGDVVRAKLLAGYSENTATTAIVNALADEIAEATRKYLSRTAPKAAFALGGAIDDPTQLGLKDKLTAARDVLDRSGFAKQEKLDVGGMSSIFILPPKKAQDDADTE